MRKHLLQTTIVNQQDTEWVNRKIENIEKEDKKFLKRKIRKIEDDIEDAQSDLNTRLSAEEFIDESVVEVLYSKIQDLKEKKKLYQKFSKEYDEKNSVKNED